MKQRRCDELAELRSAYVDGALRDHDREVLLVHLVGCASCRSEVAELRQIRSLLTSSHADAVAPSDLSCRLVSIAGGQARLPLWSRPFRRTRPGTLPSARRTVRIRTAAATVVLGSVVAAVGATGYAAAPPVELADIHDPSGRAQSDFASVLAQFPLANDSVNATMMAAAADLALPGTPTLPSPAPATGRRLETAQALTVLQRAVLTSTEVGYRGTQLVVAPRNGTTLWARVQVDFAPGQGSQISVASWAGRSVVDGFVAAPVTPRMVDPAMLPLLRENYTFGGAVGSQVSGRPATMVEAVRPDGSGGVVARWWIDDETGLLLWSETYEPGGALVLASGFVSVTIDTEPDSFLQHLPPSLTTPVTTASLTLSNADALSSHGWSCSERLLGLSLVRLRADVGDNPGVVHMVYSDGVSTVSIFEERGRLVAPGADSQWDSDLGAHVRTGPSSSATWQSGGTVFTVVTDGPTSMLRDAVRTLPHGEPLAPTTMERVRAGWLRIIERIVG